MSGIGVILRTVLSNFTACLILGSVKYSFDKVQVGRWAYRPLGLAHHHFVDRKLNHRERERHTQIT